MDIRFHVYAINWNEKHLLNHFFNHYKQADHIYILDNQSDDGSIDIINSYPNTTIISFDTGGNLDDVVHSNMKNNLWKQYSKDCDFVIVQDLDEFVFFPEYPNDIKAGLQSFKNKNITICKSNGYHIYCSDNEFKSINDQYLTSSLFNGNREPFNNIYDKVQIFSPKYITDINYGLGAHQSDPKGLINLDTESVLLLHYKYVGPTFLKDRYKIVRQRLLKFNGVGIQYKKSDNEIDIYMDDLFNKYGHNSIFKLMYKSPKIATINYRGKRCLINTYGAPDYISSSLLNNNIWEPRVANIIHELCSAEGTYFIDIGSNIGAHSCIARLAGASKIIAFECNPNTYNIINNTIKLNGWSNAIVHNIALSDNEAIVPFNIVQDNIGASYIPTTHIGWNSATIEHEGGVKAAKFDTLNIDLLGANNIVVKIDIEGHELNALNGMDTLLSNEKLSSIITEINPFCTTIDIIQQIIALLNRYGFINIKLLFSVPNDPWAGHDTNDYTYNNITVNDIIHMFNQKVVCEVLFTRQLFNTSN
jgi:FkbM family methyltransferase